VRQRKSRAAFGARTRQDTLPKRRDLEHEQHSARSGAAAIALLTSTTAAIKRGVVHHLRGRGLKAARRGPACPSQRRGSAAARRPGAVLSQHEKCYDGHHGRSQRLRFCNPDGYPDGVVGSHLVGAAGRLRPPDAEVQSGDPARAVPPPLRVRKRRRRTLPPEGASSRAASSWLMPLSRPREQSGLDLTQ
jgi:hypothetical protein